METYYKYVNRTYWYWVNRMCQYCPLISKILAEEEFLSGNSDLTASNCTKDNPERWYKKPVLLVLHKGKIHENLCGGLTGNWELWWTHRANGIVRSDLRNYGDWKKEKDLETDGFTHHLLQAKNIHSSSPYCITLSFKSSYQKL